MNAADGGLHGRHPRAVPKKGRIKGTAHTERDGINGAITVNDILHEKKRNVVRAFFQDAGLDFPHGCRADKIERGADPEHILRRQIHLRDRAGDIVGGIFFEENGV